MHSKIIFYDEGFWWYITQQENFPDHTHKIDTHMHRVRMGQDLSNPCLLSPNSQVGTNYQNVPKLSQLSYYQMRLFFELLINEINTNPK